VPSARPPSGGSFQPDDVLWPRIWAALIDLLLLAGLLVITVYAVGDLGGGLELIAGPAGAVVAFLYYFSLEAWTGRTVGKHLFGLGVTRAGVAERPSAGQVAVRTLLRIVDWWPALYLLGFIVMMATGARRQRVGDLAAGTSVTRVLVRHRGAALVPLAVVMLAAAGLGAYRDTPAGSTQTYQAHGISFDYPWSWQAGTVAPYVLADRQNLWVTSLGQADNYDFWITVSAYRVNAPVAAHNADALSSEAEADARQLLEQSGGSLQAGPGRVMMAGGLAWRFGGTELIEDSRYKTTIVISFKDTTEYVVDCSATQAYESELDRACTRVVSSFHT
jgi:uncharacterized RDD family membrane protein YckC